MSRSNVAALAAAGATAVGGAGTADLTFPAPSAAVEAALSWALLDEAIVDAVNAAIGAAATAPPMTLVATLSGHAQYVFSLAVLRDGRLASASFDKTVKLWG